MPHEPLTGDCGYGSLITWFEKLSENKLIKQDYIFNSTFYAIIFGLMSRQIQVQDILQPKRG